MPLLPTCSWRVALIGPAQRASELTWTGGFTQKAAVMTFEIAPEKEEISKPFDLCLLCDS